MRGDGIKIMQQEYRVLLLAFEQLLSAEIEESWQAPRWLHTLALCLRRLENFFAGSVLPLHAEQFAAICNRELARRAYAEQLQAHDRYLETQIRNLRRRLAKLVLRGQFCAEHVELLRERGRTLIDALREHEHEVTTDFVKVSLRQRLGRWSATEG